MSKTIQTVTGSTSASTTTIIAAVSSKRIKVFALSLITSSGTAVTATFKDAAGGTALATYPLQALSGSNMGVARAVSNPYFLWGTSAGNLLQLALSATATVTYNISYFTDDAT